MDIYSEIKADYKEFKSMFRILCRNKDTSTHAKLDLFKQLKRELKLHNKAKSNAFYTKVNLDRKERLLIHRAKEEHRFIDLLLRELDSSDATSEEWLAKMRFLRSLVQLHMKEEQTHIHAQARRELTKQEAINIGEEFLEIKQALDFTLQDMVA